MHRELPGPPGSRRAPLLAGERDTVGAVREWLTADLTAAGVPSPSVDAEWLMRHATGWSRAQLLTRDREPFPPQALETVQSLAQRRARREPLQLILGTVGFRYLELDVRAGVFIPRPETEVLAGEAIARLPAGGVVVEPCTGTGAIACAVAAEADPATVVATDASPAAVALARDNAARCAVDVTVRQGDLLDPVDLRLRGRVDVLVANPPYVAIGEVADLEPEVARWDPHGALVAGPTGHEVSDRLIAAARQWLAPAGWLLLEVAETRAPAVAARATAAGLVDARVARDLAGRDRIVAARRTARR